MSAHFVASAAISPIQIEKGVNEWLIEDMPTFDYGGGVVGSGQTNANIFVKSTCVLAGFPFAEAVLKRLGCSVKWLIPEGRFIKIPDPNTTPNTTKAQRRLCVGVTHGPANRLLQAERTVLEVLTRASACATYAYQCKGSALAANPLWSGNVAATRKTTPGSIRIIEKYGAQVGGADPHRYSLSSMVMLKDNHIDVVGGSIPRAVAAARKLCGFAVKIEVECRSEKDAIDAATAGAEVMMLDNFTPNQVVDVAPRLKKRFPHIVIEVSGGINANTIGPYAVDGVDIISVGRITHGPPPIDISMKVATPTIGSSSKAKRSKL